MNIGIIGGGASGIMAAIFAAREGGNVTILERMNRVGKKILATGNGRCNITNANIEVKSYHGVHPEFVQDAFKQFCFKDTINFFEELGIKCKNENSKIYPYSDQASSVLDVLRFEMESLNIKEECDFEVVEIKKKENIFNVYTKDGRKFEFDRVILAVGGKASPNLGSNGSGYLIAKKMGHSIINLVPALVQLKLDMPYLKAVKGVKFEGRAKTGLLEKIIGIEDGEILFTDYGISGPPILQLSRNVLLEIDRGNRPWIEVDMFPQMNNDEMFKYLKNRFLSRPLKTVEFSLIGLINKRLIIPVLKVSKIEDIHKLSKECENEEILRISKTLKSWRMNVTGSQSWTEAQVTSGGVNTMEVNPHTMESKIVKGMFITGELLDIDGDCGGFNLQWAWTSGYVAGLFSNI